MVDEKGLQLLDEASQHLRQINRADDLYKSRVVELCDENEEKERLSVKSVENLLKIRALTTAFYNSLSEDNRNFVDQIEKYQDHLN